MMYDHIDDSNGNVHSLRLDMVACGLSTELVSTTQTDRERLTDGGWWHKAEVMLAAASSEERP